MENENQDVQAAPSPAIGSQPAPASAAPAEEPQPQKPPKGFVPYQALEEEREKRKELEEKLALASAPSEPEEEVFSDEGKVLRKEIGFLKERLYVNERKEARREAEAEFPVLRERVDDFDAFLEDDEVKRLSLKKAAKLFLAENNLLAPEPPARPSLEKPSGGGQASPEHKFTNEQIEDLMKNNYPKYEALVRAGKI